MSQELKWKVIHRCKVYIHVKWPVVKKTSIIKTKLGIYVYLNWANNEKSF